MAPGVRVFRRPGRSIGGSHSDYNSPTISLVTFRLNSDHLHDFHNLYIFNYLIWQRINISVTNNRIKVLWCTKVMGIHFPLSSSYVTLPIQVTQSIRLLVTKKLCRDRNFNILDVQHVMPRRHRMAQFSIYSVTLHDQRYRRVMLWRLWFYVTTWLFWCLRSLP